MLLIKIFTLKFSETFEGFVDEDLRADKVRSAKLALQAPGIQTSDLQSKLCTPDNKLENLAD